MNLNFKLQIIFIREGRTVVAYCPALDLSSCGRNEEEAEKMFYEAASAFVESCNERGVLDEALEELGWARLGESSWTPPQVISPPREISLSL